MTYNCVCGSTAYRCKECGWQWCANSRCRKGNGKNDGQALNKCPRCSGYGATSGK